MKTNAPQFPGPVSTPGHVVTSSVICALALCFRVMSSLLSVTRTPYDHTGARPQWAIGPRTSPGQAVVGGEREELDEPLAERHLDEELLRLVGRVDQVDLLPY